MPTCRPETIAAFREATENGRTLRAGKCHVRADTTTISFSRETLERLVAAGHARRIETVGHGWAGPDGRETARSFPASVRYARA